MWLVLIFSPLMAVANEPAIEAYEQFHQTVLVRHCQRCHQRPNSWLFYVSTAEETRKRLIEQGYVTPGEWQTGTLFTRISGESWFVSSMPPSGFSWEDEDEDKRLRNQALELLRIWLEEETH